MELQQAIRKQQKIRLALYGRSGSGKTMSALLLAFGLCGDWSKIGLIDTEDRSASLYSHLGPFSTVQIGAPFKSSRYFEAIDLIGDAGKEVIIIDSLSPEWHGEGGIKDRFEKQDWEQALREHRVLLSFISRCECHIICTMRSKQKLVRMKEDNKRYYELVETPVQQEGIEYIFTTVLKLNGKHLARPMKDRTGIFSERGAILLESDHGLFLQNWCNQGEPEVPQHLQAKINACQTINEVHQLLAKENIQDVELISAFTRRRMELENGLRNDKPSMIIV